MTSDDGTSSDSSDDSSMDGPTLVKGCETAAPPRNTGGHGGQQAVGLGWRQHLLSLVERQQTCTDEDDDHIAAIRPTILKLTQRPPALGPGSASSSFNRVLHRHASLARLYPHHPDSHDLLQKLHAKYYPQMELVALVQQEIPKPVAPRINRKFGAAIGAIDLGLKDELDVDLKGFLKSELTQSVVAAVERRSTKHRTPRGFSSSSSAAAVAGPWRAENHVPPPCNTTELTGRLQKAVDKTVRSLDASNDHRPMWGGRQRTRPFTPVCSTPSARSMLENDGMVDAGTPRGYCTVSEDVTSPAMTPHQLQAFATPRRNRPMSGRISEREMGPRTPPMAEWPASSTPLAMMQTSPVTARPCSLSVDTPGATRLAAVISRLEEESAEGLGHDSDNNTSAPHGHGTIFESASRGSGTQQQGPL